MEELDSNTQSTEVDFVPSEGAVSTAGEVEGAAPTASADQAVDAEQQIRTISRRSLLWGAAAVAAVAAGRQWLITRRDDDGLPWPFRRALDVNEQVARDLYRNGRAAPTFDRSLAEKEPRVNGDEGLPEDFDAAEWKLHVSGLDAGSELLLRLGDIKSLPRIEMVTELKCIEGWSNMIHWTGARFSDLAMKHKPMESARYVSLMTPDEGYYVGLDMESALHPQTLLAYEINGRPLTPDHGAPLRLVIPVKYGIKNIKRIGTIRFTESRPADYWAERGYDWYAGL